MNAATPGLYGKLPALGDFVQRRLPATLVDPWDEWLRAALAASRAALGETWLERYLTCPLWHFVLSPGLAGPGLWTGVLMPSVDRVGRYFPLTIACPLPPTVNPIAVPAATGWFAHADALVLTALDEPPSGQPFSLDTFAAAVAALGVPPVPGPARATAAQPPGQAQAWHLRAPPVSPLADLFTPAAADGLASGPAAAVPEQPAVSPLPAVLAPLLVPLLEQTLQSLFHTYSLWWTQGSDQVEPALLVTQGLPAPDAFTALLSGDWGAAGWHSLDPPPAAHAPGG